ncbi:hypothetical protein HY449_04340 [Candidatus Pacearchaeota archaeon]|nr:hypothetical protein [Candidatus Pacearchaeota archaeon]
MTIKNSESLSMPEVEEYLDKSSDLTKFIKKFTKETPKSAVEMRKEIEMLDVMKIKPEHISKIIDILPENHEDINKIFTDVSLDDEESKKILDAVKSNK